MSNSLRRARRLSAGLPVLVAAAIAVAPSIAPAPPAKHRMHTLRHLCKPDSQPCPKLMPDCSCSAGRLMPSPFPPEASP